jgi:hypothetical protein
MEQRFDVNQLRIAKPCSASWGEMSGDEQRRFCGACKKNVYNVAGMTEREVRELITRSEVLPCLRLTRRADGRVLTRDCPVGVARFRQKAFLGAMACLAFGFTVVGAFAGREKKSWEGETLADHLRTKPVIGPVIDKLCPTSIMAGEMMPMPSPMVGKIATPPHVVTTGIAAPNEVGS